MGSVLSFVQKLWRVEVLGVRALVMVASAIAIFSGLQIFLSGDQALGWTFATFVGFWYTLIIGLVPVGLLGAPLYVTYLVGSRLKLWHVYATATIPGLVFLWVDDFLAVPALLSGLCVVFLVDRMAKVWPRFGQV